MERSRFPEEFDAVGEQGGGIDILGLLGRRKWILLFGVAVGVGLGYLYFIQQVPLYQSASRIFVIKPKADSELPIRGVGNRFDDNLATQALLIRSPLIVGRAVEKHELGKLRSFAGMSDPTAYINKDRRTNNSRMSPRPAGRGQGDGIARRMRPLSLPLLF